MILACIVGFEKYMNIIVYNDDKLINTTKGNGQVATSKADAMNRHSPDHLSNCLKWYGVIYQRRNSDSATRNAPIVRLSTLPSTFNLPNTRLI